MPTNNHDLQFTVPIDTIECFASGDPNNKGSLTVRGHAAVYNRRSHDLGGFRTVIAPGAFDAVLDGNPDVHLVIDHDTRYVLARTANKTLELRSDPMGLHMWANMAPTSYAKDLAILMERGDVNQMSFACDIGEDEWTVDSDENVTRTIYSVSGLYDVTICAQGAFPQTDAQLVASFRDAGKDLASAIEAGRVHEYAPGVAPPLTAALADMISGEIGGKVGVGREGVAQDTEDAGSPGGEPVGAASVAEVRAARLAALKERAAAVKLTD